MENVFSFITDLFLSDGIIIAVAVYVLGEIVKTSIKFIKNQYIPLLGGVAGVILGLTIPTIFPEADIMTKAIYGLALGWAATGGFETFKGLTKKTEE